MQLAQWWEWIPARIPLVVMLVLDWRSAPIVVGLENGEVVESTSGLMKRFEPIGLAFFVFVVVPFHELSHAVACPPPACP